MSYKELQAKYKAETGNYISLTTISKRVKKLNRLPTIEELRPQKNGRPPKFKEI